MPTGVRAADTIYTGGSSGILKGTLVVIRGKRRKKLEGKVCDLCAEQNRAFVNNGLGIINLLHAVYNMIENKGLCNEAFICNRDIPHDRQIQSFIFGISISIHHYPRHRPHQHPQHHFYVHFPAHHPHPSHHCPLPTSH